MQRGTTWGKPFPPSRKLRSVAAAVRINPVGQSLRGSGGLCPSFAAECFFLRGTAGIGIPAFARAGRLHAEPSPAVARVARSQARAFVLEGVEMMAKILLPVVGLVSRFPRPQAPSPRSPRMPVSEAPAPCSERPTGSTERPTGRAAVFPTTRSPATMRSSVSRRTSPAPRSTRPKSSPSRWPIPPRTSSATSWGWSTETRPARRS